MSRRHALAAAIAIAGLLAAAGAGAQTVYRCNNEYSRTPCPDGKALDPSDPTTAARRAEAARVARDEKQLGETMERDRHAAEAARPPPAAATLSPARPASAAPRKSKAKKRRKAPAHAAAERPDDFIVTVPKAAKKPAP